MAIHKVDGVDGDANFPKKFVRLNITLSASASITKGQAVALDLDDTTNGLGGSVKLAPVGAASNQAGAMCFGIANETITNPSSSVSNSFVLQVQTAGKFEDAFVVDGIAAGETLVGPLNGATAGSLSEVTSSTFGGPIFGYALETEGTGTGESGTALRADIMIIDQGLF